VNAFRQYIGGGWVDAAGGGTWDLVDPATEDVIQQVPYGGAADVGLAVDAAAAALDEWAAATPEVRMLLRKVKESGRPVSDVLKELERALQKLGKREWT